ncbi:MAG: 1-(5-phosphoribosyl)-5-[(5-phosphoribosylamino)methylideneamino]imidazole-4-carboxamide isomerase [Oscillospiraceae bacterium]
MNIFPAIDLFDGKAVRLLKGDYDNMTIYSADPPQKAMEFVSSGAEYIHLVDLEGAKDGRAVNFDTAAAIIKKSGLKAEIGGGIRTEDVIKRYLDIGAMRVILGTAALESPDFLGEMVSKYGEKIAVGVDVRDGFVAVKGWLETSTTECFDFISKLVSLGVKTVICTDISKDGAMRGTNRELYRELSRTFPLDIVASGGVSTLEDVRALRELSLYGAILGRAIYTGGIDLKEAIEVAR